VSTDSRSSRRTDRCRFLGQELRYPEGDGVVGRPWQPVANQRRQNRGLEDRPGEDFPERRAIAARSLPWRRAANPRSSGSVTERRIVEHQERRQRADDEHPAPTPSRAGKAENRIACDSTARPPADSPS